MSDTGALANRPYPSHVFPDAEDMAEWNALSPAEQAARIESAEQAGYESGEAPPESLAQRLTRVRGR